jgi:probable rRNA maturation factor
MKLLYLNQSRDKISPAWLEKWVKALSRELAKRRHKGIARKELVLVFVNSTEMRRMNRQYREKDYATDVLSFHPVEPTSLGELVLCLPTIRSQAKRSGLSERGELGYMIVHGVLHLLGYDHEDRADETKMFALQDGIYAKLEKSVGLR